MLTRKSETLKKIMQSAKPVLENTPIDFQRKGLHILGKLSPIPKEQQVKTDFASPTKNNSEWIINKNAPKDYALIYMHGGAYCSGDLSYCRNFASKISQHTDLNVYYFEYRLAPENPFPSALEDALAHYFYILDSGYSCDKIALIGDSAGGGLILSLCLALMKQNKPLPKVLVCLSPWADLENTGKSELTNANDDPILNPIGLMECAKLYAGDNDLTNPLISPVYGEFNENFPSTLIHIGTNDILLADSLELERNMRHCGVDVTIDLYDGMWHVFHLFDVAESETAFLRIKNYLYNKLKIGD